MNKGRQRKVSFGRNPRSNRDGIRHFGVAPNRGSGYSEAGDAPRAGEATLWFRVFSGPAGSRTASLATLLFGSTCLATCLLRSQLDSKSKNKSRTTIPYAGNRLRARKEGPTGAHRENSLDTKRPKKTATSRAPSRRSGSGASSRTAHGRPLPRTGAALRRAFDKKEAVGATGKKVSFRRAATPTCSGPIGGPRARMKNQVARAAAGSRRRGGRASPAS
jgi:hypothetical protein